MNFIKAALKFLFCIMTGFLAMGSWDRLSTAVLDDQYSGEIYLALWCAYGAFITHFWTIIGGERTQRSLILARNVSGGAAMFFAFGALTRHAPGDNMVDGAAAFFLLSLMSLGLLGPAKRPVKRHRFFWIATFGVMTLTGWIIWPGRDEWIPWVMAIAIIPAGFPLIFEISRRLSRN